MMELIVPEEDFYRNVSEICTLSGKHIRLFKMWRCPGWTESVIKKLLVFRMINV